MKTWKLSVLVSAVMCTTIAQASEPRSESRAYNVKGLLESIDGPRADVTDVTRYTYDENGRLATITDAMGYVTRYSDYDSLGNPGAVTDPNHVITRLTYTPEGWLESTGRDAGGSLAVSKIEYDLAGDVVKTIDADGVVTRYVYDDARRMVEIIDGEGNRIHYTLDAAGNRLKEETFDATGASRRKVSRTFNGLGQLMSVLDGMGRTVLAFDTGSGHDAAGHAIESADAAGVRRKLGYDGLGRLVSTLEDYSGSDEATRDTQMVISYDPEGNIDGVSDPEGLNTLYARNGFGDVTEQNSPDAGKTRYTYDAAGNVITATDARGIRATYAYDALNRRISASFADGASNAQWMYDESSSATGCKSSYPIGRLTRVIERAVTTTYCYDARGNVTEKRQTQGALTDTVTYAYTAGDRLAHIGRPDGGTTVYARDVLGRIVTVSDIPQGGVARIVASQVAYLPFGPVRFYVLGNGQTLARTYDANYAVTDIVSPAFELHLTRDESGRVIESQSGDSLTSETYQYDALSRLRSVAGPGRDGSETYTYNSTGDRLSKYGGGLATGDYSYLEGTHYLASAGADQRAYDASGNTISRLVGGEFLTFIYSSRNRLTSVTSGGVVVGTYVYNVRGQRIRKFNPNSLSDIRFVYDESDTLVGEFGASARGYIWMDDVLVGSVDRSGEGNALNYIHVDALGSPRSIADVTGNVVWQWRYRSNPFGEVYPSSIPGYVFNFRLPGQYFDIESSDMYNVNRQFEPASGRYMQSDPLGLYAGINTFAYASSDPLRRTDRLGLDDGYCRIDPTWCGWPMPKRTESNASFGINETGVAAVLGEQAETGVIIDTTPNICVYSRLCGMAATGVGAGGSAGLSLGVGSGALSSGTSHTASLTAQTGAGVLSGGAIDFDVSSGNIAASRGFLGAGGGAYAGMFVCRIVTQCVREPETDRNDGCN